jgi:uncharacterized protein (TIGR02246 family)
MRFFILVLALLVAGPQVKAATAEEAVAAATQSWVDAFNSRDPERVLALYDQDAVLWGTSSATLRKTPQSRREYFKSMPERPNARVLVTDQNIRVFGNVAVNSGAYSFTNQEADKTTSMSARFSFTYRQQNGRWIIVDHHSSAVPISAR